MANKALMRSVVPIEPIPEQGRDPTATPSPPVTLGEPYPIDVAPGSDSPLEILELTGSHTEDGYNYQFDLTVRNTGNNPVEVNAVTVKTILMERDVTLLMPEYPEVPPRTWLCEETVGPMKTVNLSWTVRAPASGKWKFKVLVSTSHGTEESRAVQIRSRSSWDPGSGVAAAVPEETFVVD